MMRPKVLMVSGCLALALSGSALVAQRLALRQGKDDVRGSSMREMPGLAPNDRLLFNGWGITPSGDHVRFASDMPLKMAVAPDHKAVVAICAGYNATGLRVVSLDDRKETQFLPLPRTFNGLAFSADGKRLFASGGPGGEVNALTYADGKLTPETVAKPDPEDAAAFVAGIAVHPDTGDLYVCNEAASEVWRVDPVTLKKQAAIRTGAHPHSCVFGADRQHLYVSNWGAQSVSIIDTETGKWVRDVNVGLRPNDMAVAPDGRLFVACAGDNTVYVIQTRVLETRAPEADATRQIPTNAREIISTSLYPSSPEGSTPDGVAVSPDGKTLYVANADNNDVLVGDISNKQVTIVSGFIPVGWYPTAVVVSPADGTLLVGNGKGLQSRPNSPPRLVRPRGRRGIAFDYIGNTLTGAVTFIQPDTGKLAEYTEQVRLNSPYTPETLRQAPIASNSIIPDRVGAPCPIKHILYIIQENRTYDQVFGAFTDTSGKHAGNGDPNLTMFGENVTPNRHQIARDYVLLDNLYCNGEVSVDGHSWCDAAIATDAKQRAWIMSYSKHGTLPENREMDDPAAGYLWDVCRRNGISFKCYGEGSARVPMGNRGTWPGGRDMNRVSGWIQDLQTSEKTGDLPQFMIMSLGEDHTSGTTPGKPTPEAAVASNDLGIGKIVQAATRSQFWKEMAIFVIEDDAQNGPDHVDAHRTAGLVISPYTKRSYVDSTFYTTASMVRTMELILGVPPMTQYDAGATPMFNSFTKKAQLTPYSPRQPRVDVNALNKETAPGAAASAKMDFDEYDMAPEDPLNRILWRAVKGPDVPYPTPIHRAVFTRR